MRGRAEDRPGGRHQERAPAADLPVPRDDDGVSVASDSDGEFEFPSVSREPAGAAWAGGAAAAADELFAGGRIRAFYPVFGRVLDDAAPAPAPSSRAPLGRLFQLEQARTSSVASTSSSSSSASTADADSGLDGVPPDSYCLWAPGSSPASSPSRPPRKSGSTGSINRWRRIGELVVGRSHSDGKHKFLFLSAPPSPARDRDHQHSPAGSKSKPPAKGNKTAAATELDTIAAGRRMSYGGGKASPGGRRTFLPYRQDLVGLFANPHGLSSRSSF